jgi:hypothetical protein
MPPFYKVTDSADTVFASDVDQFSDAFSGANDVGAITLFAQINPPIAPTVAVNATAGNLNGAYKYAIAFVTGYWKGVVNTGTLITQGNTGGGTISGTVSPASQQVDLTAIPVGPTGTVARVIYRTKAGGSTYFAVSQINDNTSTTYTDNIADSSLTIAMPASNTTGTTLASPNLTGTPTATTATAGANTKQIANAEFVQTELTSKLDATAYTAADVLAKFKTVDGAGSGADADLFDGLESDRFIFGANNSGATSWATGVNNIQKSGFYYINTSYTGLPANAQGDGYLTQQTNAASNDYSNALQTFTPWGSDKTFFRRRTKVFINGVSGSEGGEIELQRPVSATALTANVLVDISQNKIRFFENVSPFKGAHLPLTAGGVDTNIIWHSGNDGAGSGLDADTLDGIDSTAFAKVNTNIPSGGDLNAIVTSGFYRMLGAPVNGPANVADGQLIVSRGSDTVFQIVTGYSNSEFYMRHGNPTQAGSAGGSWLAWRRLWHEGNLIAWQDGNAPRDLSARGYQKLPNGLIFQWQNVTISASDQVCNIAIAWPNICLSMQATCINQSLGYTASVSQVSNTLYHIITNAPNGSQVYILAVGY